MKTKFLSMAVLLCISATAMGAAPAQPNRKVLAAALDQHLQQYGDLCLGKFDWPIDVSDKDIAAGSRDAVQMPALEKMGLVLASTESMPGMEEGQAEAVVSVKRYALTDAGKKFYLNRETRSVTSGGKEVVHQGDFCAGKLSLNTLVRWDQPVPAGEGRETTASYTYKFKAAHWTRDPEMRRVFPMVQRIIDGAGTMELKQRLRWTKNTWVGVNLWQ